MDIHPNAPAPANGTTNGNGTAHLPARQPKPPMMTGGKIAALIPTTFDEVWRIADLCVASGLAPRDLNTQARAAVAILHGMELGMPPMMAMQRIAVINGRPTVWGDAVPAIAIATGEVAALHEAFMGTPYEDDYTAVCRVERMMGSSGTVIVREATFSVADAKQAGLWDERQKVQRKRKDGSGTWEADNDSPWHRFPKRMLQMRARVAIRDLFADAMCGLYIAEEMVGRDSDAQMRDVTPASTAEVIHNPLGGGDDAGEFDHEAAEAESYRQEAQRRHEEGTTEDAGKGAAGESDDGTGAGQPAEAKASPGPADAAGDAKKTTTRKRQTKPAKDAAAKAAEPTGAESSPGPHENQHQQAQVDRKPAESESSPDTWNVRFPEPWIKQSAQSYVNYAMTWIAGAHGKQAARDRWNNERAIRNGLSEPIPGNLVAQCQEAMGRIAA